MKRETPQLGLDFQPLHTVVPMVSRAQARADAEEGAQRAADHAERVHGSWKEAALERFQKYALAHRGQDFMTEDVVHWSEAQGFPAPPDRRAWGHVASTARRAGYVIAAGVGPQKSGNCHGAWKTKWRSAR